MERCLFKQQVISYLNDIKPAKRGPARWHQYEQEKGYLLAVVPPAMYDVVIRRLADRLHI